jgi:cytochrome c556
MNRALTLALLPLAACACAASSAAPSSSKARPAISPAGPGPTEIVAARQAAFNLTAATFGAMKPAIEAGGDVKSLGFGARGIARWGAAMPAMFPLGSDLATDRARPEIWTNKADFDSKAAALTAAATALADAAQANDKAAAATAYAELGKTCGGCHQLYRAEAPR